jgi:hypothetical protein
MANIQLMIRTEHNTNWMPGKEAKTYDNIIKKKPEHVKKYTL